MATLGIYIRGDEQNTTNERVYAALMVLPLLLIRSLDMSMNVVVVIPADRNACSSPGISARKVFAALLKVSGLPVTISRSLTAYLRRLSAIVVGAAACAELSRGTAKTRFVGKV